MSSGGSIRQHHREVCAEAFALSCLRFGRASTVDDSHYVIKDESFKRESTSSQSILSHHNGSVYQQLCKWRSPVEAKQNMSWQDVIVTLYEIDLLLVSVVAMLTGSKALVQLVTSFVHVCHRWRITTLLMLLRLPMQLLTGL